MKKQLKTYNLVKNKHVPNEYLINSKDTRLKVLAGMIDTDGTVSREGTRVNISQGPLHENLLKQIMLLSKSLGFMATTTKKKVTWTHKGIKKEGYAFGLNISGNGIEEIPTLLNRKKCHNPKKRETTSIGTLTIEQYEDGDYVTIEVDGSGRFVNENFIVM